MYPWMCIVVDNKKLTDGDNESVTSAITQASAS